MTNWNTIGRWLVAMGAVICLHGCIEPCEAPEVEAINALYFEFARDGDSGFSEEQINNMYIARFFPAIDTIISDTFFLGGNYPLGSGQFYINNHFPFENKSAPYFPFYRYEIFTADLTTIHVVDSIDLDGSYIDDCTYANKGKTFLLDGQFTDRSGSREFVKLYQQ